MSRKGNCYDNAPMESFRGDHVRCFGVHVLPPQNQLELLTFLKNTPPYVEDSPNIEVR